MTVETERRHNAYLAWNATYGWKFYQVVKAIGVLFRRSLNNLQFIYFDIFYKVEYAADKLQFTH